MELHEDDRTEVLWVMSLICHATTAMSLCVDMAVATPFAKKYRNDELNRVADYMS